MKHFSSIVKDSFSRKSTESFFWRVASVVVLFVMHIALGRYLPLEDYGEVNYTMSAARTATLFTTLGFPTLVVSLLPRYSEGNQWSLIAGLLTRSIQLPLILSVSVSCFLAFIYPGFRQSDILLFFIVLLPLLALLTIGRYFFLGLHNLRGFIFPQEVLLPGLVVIAVLFWAPDNGKTVLTIYVSATLLVLLLTGFWLMKVLPVSCYLSEKVYQTKAWVTASIPLLLGGASQLLMSQMGVLLLGQLDSMRGVGLFSAAMRFSLLITFVMTAVNMVGSPLIAKEFQRREGNKLADVVARARRWSTFGALPVFLTLFLFPGFFLGLMGNEFLNGAALLRILSCGYLINAMTGLAGSVLIMTGNGSFFGKTTFLAMLLCLLAMFLTIPLWGATGAAVSFSIVLAGMNIVHLQRANTIVRTA